MFIGHFGLALGTRRFAALPSLAMLFIAVQFLDLLWPVFVLLGLENFSIDPGNTAMTPLNFSHYPYSHSLLMAVVWGMALALVYFVFTRNKRGAVILGALVVSHWLLDYLTHAPDLQLAPWNPARFGLGLWNHPAAELTLEIAIYIGGAYLYFKQAQPKRKWAFISLVAILFLIHLANIFGPPPPSVQAVAYSALLLWLFVIWAWWIER